MAAFAEYQDELYAQGLAGHQPQYPTGLAELEEKASAAMPPKVWEYVAGGAGDEHTRRANCEVFWGLCPRMLVAPAERDMSIELFGVKLPSPDIPGGCAVVLVRGTRYPRISIRQQGNR